MDDIQQQICRRSFLGRSAYGLGGIALAWLLGDRGRAFGQPKPPHFPAKAKRVIHLCMAGGPSQFESLDHKPELKKLDGKPFPESFTRGQQLAQLQGSELKARGPFCEFKKWGKSGLEVSTLFPHVGSVADELCVVKSLHTEQINHDPAHAFMNSGSIQKGRPSMVAWVLYGLGAETDSLPGFIVLTSAGKSGLQPISARQWSSGFLSARGPEAAPPPGFSGRPAAGRPGSRPSPARQWSSGFLPSKFQGVQFQSRGNAVHYVGLPGGGRPGSAGYPADNQRQLID